jgi:hypothetical protein
MGGQGKFIYGLGGETRGTGGLEELSMHGKIIFKRKFKKRTGRGAANWIGLAQDRDGWRALVKKVANLWVL